MELAIIKYNAGNIQSVLYALERIGVEATVTDVHEKILNADKVILPGVGEANSAMQYLKERNLDKVFKSLKQPVLGICLGLQVMCRYSEENDTTCMGIFDEDVKLFKPVEKSDEVELSVLRQNNSSGAWPPSPAGEGLRVRHKVPQIGWNTIYNLKSGLFRGLKEDSYCYFVHGYYAAIGEHTIATTDYIQPYSSALHKENFYGVQFHPEKSAGVGEQIIKNFLAI